MNYLTMLEREEKEKQKREREYVLRNVPAKCSKCPHLQILSVKKVYCPYMINGCILNK